MDLKAPIATIMTNQLITVASNDPVRQAKECLDTHRIHHLPVLEDEKLVGILSASDVLHFMRYIDKDSQEPYLNDLRLKNYKVAEIMQKNIVTVNASDSIKSVLEVFNHNLFHALPVMDKENLVGIVTTLDIVKALLDS